MTGPHDSRDTLSGTSENNMRNSITEFLRTSHTCHLFVSLEICRLEDTVTELLALYDWPRLSVGQELCAVLLADLPTRRPRAARRWMETRLGQMAIGPVLCTEIDLLFEPALELDPLRLMRDVGRVTRLAVTWPGSYQDDVLAYATPGHSHYRTWRKPKVSMLVLE